MKSKFVTVKSGNYILNTNLDLIKYSFNKKFLGFDSETIKGYTRLVGISDNTFCKIYSYKDLHNFLSKYHNIFFICFNAEYDIQSILKWLPNKIQTDLFKGIDVTYDNIKYQYFQNKLLKFNDNYIFDIFQFYKCSLKDAAKKYLCKRKGSINVSKINIKNIYTQKCIKYCIKDAKLAYELFMKIHDTLPQKIKNVKPISAAYYASKFFETELEDNKLSKNFDVQIKNAVHGGRIELLEKGYFKNVYCYDLHGAYLTEIEKLQTFKDVVILNVKKYLPNATYSIYHINVTIPFIQESFISPLCCKAHRLLVFPVGNYRGYVTKREFESVMQYKPVIRSAVHFFCKKEYPFIEKIKFVYAKKKVTNLPFWKMFTVGLNGKFGMHTRKYSKNGQGKIFDIYKSKDNIDNNENYFFQKESFNRNNLVYQAEVLAGIRLKMYEIMKQYPNEIIACQTDSLIVKKRLPLPIGKNLGQWKVEKWNELYIIGNGLCFYRKNKMWYGKFRSYNMNKKDVIINLKKLLNSDKKYVTIKSTEHTSIQEAKRTQDEKLANIIRIVDKKLNIDCDKKRIWLSYWKNGKEIKTKNIKSLAIVL